MARRRKRGNQTTQYLWYGAYAIGAYYLYNWWMGSQYPMIASSSTPVVVPGPTP